MLPEMNFRDARTGKFPRLCMRGGFSLIIVLIVLSVGFIIIGATLNMIITSSGSARVISAGNTKYNFMQEAVQLGQTNLKAAMNNPKDPPKYGGGPIREVEDLLVELRDFTPFLPHEGWNFDGRTFSWNLVRSDLGKLGIAGPGANLTVKIYDMQYSASSVAADITEDAKKWLPPAIRLHGAIGLGIGNPEAGELGGGWEGSSELPNPDSGSDPNPNPSPPQPTSQAGNAGIYLIRATMTIAGQDDKPTVLDTAVIQANRP